MQVKTHWIVWYAMAITFVCAPAVAASTAFVNVNVIPMTTETVLQNQTVVVADGVILAVGPSDTIVVEPNTEIVDGSDRFLMPGLAEMHAHIGGDRAFDRLAALFVANGVTTVRGMLGREAHLRLRDDLEAGVRFGPRLVTSGPSLNGNSVRGAADAAAKVRAQHDRGYDFIKVHPGLTATEYTALAETANSIGMPFAGHVPAAAGTVLALDLKMATIDHLDSYFVAMLGNDKKTDTAAGFFGIGLADQVDRKKLRRLAAATAAAGTWNVPTEVLVEQTVDRTTADQFLEREEMRFVEPALLQRWLDNKAATQSDSSFDQELADRAIHLRRELIFELHKAGAGLLLGSDAPQVFNVPGFSLHRELGVLVASGLSPYEALQTGTTAVADFLATTGGAIAPGKQADLILLNANPLKNIENSREIEGVMLRGQWISRCKLDEMLARHAVLRDDRMGATKGRQYETCTASARFEGRRDHLDSS